LERDSIQLMDELTTESRWSFIPEVEACEA
jgi:hypothetical protein